MNTPQHTRPTMSFRWSGRDRQGQAQSGEIQALSADLARVQLRRQGLQQVQVQRLWWSPPDTVKAKDLAVMTRQWAAMLRAGVPVVQALGMLCRSMSAQGLVAVMQHVRGDVEAGVALHDALAKHPKHFSGLYVHMVQAGEAAGILDTMMERLSLTLEKNEAMRSKIRSALMYPIAVMGVALGILVLILVLVVPVFQDVFQSFGAELPLATQLVVGMSNALVRAWPAALPLALFPALGLALGPARGPAPALGPSLDPALSPALGPALGPAQRPSADDAPPMGQWDAAHLLVVDAEGEPWRLLACWGAPTALALICGNCVEGTVCPKSSGCRAGKVAAASFTARSGSYAARARSCRCDEHCGPGSAAPRACSAPARGCAAGR